MTSLTADRPSTSLSSRPTGRYEVASPTRHESHEKSRMTEDGLEAIFMTHRPMLLRFFAARGGGADIDDLLQELWLKVRSAQTGPIAEPASYLFRMADNLLLDRRRADLRRSRRDDQWTGITRGTVIDVADTPSAERVMIARERLRLVDDAIDALGERTAGIFRSYRIEGAHQRDIAARIGISLSAVEKHLQKAYRPLAEVRGRLDADSDTPRRLDVEGTNDVAD